MDATTIDLRPLSTQRELRACVELQQATWGESFSDVVPVSILKVCQRIGGVAVGAFDPAQSLLGFVFGLTGVERGRTVHWSDMLAVKPEARNIGLGRRLKEHQRHIVREQGAAVIYWTFDPLIARNAHLNFNRLGVRLTEYAEDMYGVTDSVLHGGLATDRLVVAWPTHDDEIQERLEASACTAASVDCQNAPIATDEWIAGATGAAILPHCVRVEIPADAERMLLEAPESAATWRRTVRASIQWALSAGYTISAFYPDEQGGRGYYLMTKVARITAANGRG